MAASNSRILHRSKSSVVSKRSSRCSMLEEDDEATIGFDTKLLQAFVIDRVTGCCMGKFAKSILRSLLMISQEQWKRKD
jgi:hypothetical protein